MAVSKISKATSTPTIPFSISSETLGVSYRFSAAGDSYSSYLALQFLFSSSNYVQLVIYDSGRVDIQRYDNGWKPSVTLRNAD